MVNKLYRSGRAFEYRVMRDLEKNGYYVLRSGKSKFPDLCAIPRETGRLPLLVECKYGLHPHLSKQEKGAYASMTDLNAILVVALGKPRKKIEYLQARVVSNH